MDTLSLELPSMYGDHHVIEVRRLLAELPGIASIYASSSFQMVEVGYDPAQITAEDIQVTLDDAGYLVPLTLPMESAQAADQQDNSQTYFRHTAAYVQTGTAVSFAQRVSGSASESRVSATN